MKIIQLFDPHGSVSYGWLLTSSASNGAYINFHKNTLAHRNGDTQPDIHSNGWVYT